MVVSKFAQNIVRATVRHDNDYPLWTGPCGAGPLGGITQSMLVRFLSCRERFRLKYVLGLEPYDKWNHHVGYGNMWHVCEEALASNDHSCDGLKIREWEDALFVHANQQLQQYPLQREEITKWWRVCQVQFPEYIKYWSQHPDVLDRTPLMQEQVFDVPYQLPSGRAVRLRGKFDSVDLIGGGIYLQENKTKSDVNRTQIERQLKFDLQTMLYLVALHEEQTNVWDCEAHDAPPGQKRREIRGVRYNVVKRDCPIKQHEGRQLKAGWKPSETVEHWMERLRDEYYSADPAKYFFRVRAEVGARDVQAFRDTCLDPLLETVCDWYQWITKNELLTVSYPAMNYRTPFGIWSALEEDGSTEYDAFLESGSETGLRRAESLFGELQPMEE